MLNEVDLILSYKGNQYHWADFLSFQDTFESLKKPLYKSYEPIRYSSYVPYYTLQTQRTFFKPVNYFKKILFYQFFIVPFFKFYFFLQQIFHKIVNTLKFLLLEFIWLTGNMTSFTVYFSGILHRTYKNHRSISTNMCLRV